MSGLPRYALGRLGQALFVLWAAFTVSFIILYVLPGDAVTVLLGTETYIDPAEIERLRQHYGLDQPAHVQYFVQLGNVLRGDLGVSIQTGASVVGTLLGALPETLILTLTALTLAIAAAAGIAFAAAYTRSPRLRQTILSLPPLGVSVPTFWIGLTLLQLFSFRLPLFPAIGNAGLASLVLPAVTLAIPTSAALAKVFAQGLDHAGRQPFVDAARARGTRRVDVLFRHVAKNALLPSVTLLAVTVGGLLAGSVVTETVFSRVGIGRVAFTAVTAQDLPVVQGVVILAAGVFALANLVTDLLYPVLDPRVSLRAPAREVLA
ncbi:ABC transporter permease [Microbacterium sp. 18062]|uniref:ABC transporter permease n=1 Tax=Microbacterium sp. 18062 TaxID=2681410 RepID=UPI001359AC39|nr:ABC transporter permease [Microbacterium sp. 18062]